LLDYEVVGKSILYRVLYYDKLPMGTWLAVTPLEFRRSRFVFRGFWKLETRNSKTRNLGSWSAAHIAPS